MSLFNENLKNITLKELCIVIISTFIIFYALKYLNIISLNSTAMYVVLIFFFIFKLRDSFLGLSNDLKEIFLKDSIKSIILVVILNIFLSYGFLYLGDFILKSFPNMNFLINAPLSSIYLNNSLSLALGFIAIVVVSPISEELVFRGVMLNRIKLFVPTKFAILITSLLFASLHTYGSITSAFIFAMCMAVLYLKTDNIFVPMFAHFLNNLLAESIVALDSQNLLFTNSVLIYSVSILSIISLVVLFILLKNEWNKII